MHVTQCNATDTAGCSKAKWTKIVNQTLADMGCDRFTVTMFLEVRKLWTKMDRNTEQA